MTQEAEPRIEERPATHKKRVQVWFGVALGVIMVFLLVLTVWNIIQKSGGGSASAEAQKTPAQERAERQPDPERTSFDELVERRPPSRNLGKDEEPEPEQAATSPADAFPELRQQDGGDQGQQAQAQTESAAEKALRQWKEQEQLRALQSAQTEWGFAKASNAGSRASQSSAASTPPGRPQADNLEQRRQEVQQRIQEAKQLREKLLAKAEGGGNSPGGGNPQANQQALQSLTQSFDEPPEDVAGYTEQNAYNADVAGKLAIPPGTVVPAVWSHKAMSDYDGSTVKGLVSHDVYDISSQYVLIPKGTEILMKVNRIKNVNEAIQARVGFTVFKGVLPDGRVIDLTKATGLDREGIGAIKDQVDYHFMAQFLGVAAYALVSSESSRAGSGISNDNTYAGDVGQSMREQFSPLAQKYINLVPTVTIRPGQSFRIMFEETVYVEPWKDLYAEYVD